MFLDQVLHKRGIRRGDSTAKSFLKTLSWRIVGTIDTICIALILTGEIGVAVSIGSVEVFTKLVLYYIHERVWNKFV